MLASSHASPRRRRRCDDRARGSRGPAGAGFRRRLGARRRRGRARARACGVRRRAARPGSAAARRPRGAEGRAPREERPAGADHHGARLGRRPRRRARRRRRRLPGQAVRSRRAARAHARGHAPPRRPRAVGDHLRRADARSGAAQGAVPGCRDRALGARVRGARGADERARRRGLARPARERGVRLGRGDRLELDRSAPAPSAPQTHSPADPPCARRGLPRSAIALDAPLKSIRRTLVLWLVGALALGSLAVLAGTYALTRDQVGRVFDEELRQVALAVHVREDWMQARRVRIARPGFSLSVRPYGGAGRIYFETLMPSLPGDTPQIFSEGLSDVGTADGPLHVYTHVTPEGIVQVGQPIATRDALSREFSLPVLMPMLLLIPLLAALFAWALRRGLAPFQVASQSVSDRDVSRLDPLPTSGLPRELLPLVGQINALLQRHAAPLDPQRRFLADAALALRSPASAPPLPAQHAHRAYHPTARHPERGR